MDIYTEYGIDIINLDPKYIIPEKTVRTHLLGLEEYGFARPVVIKIVKKMPPILSYVTKLTNAKLLNLEEYGFARPVVIKMIEKIPSILSLTIERTNKTLLNLEKYGFKRSVVIKMVEELPQILGYTAKRINTLLKIFAEINFDIIDNPKHLMFSPKLLRARINFWQREKNRLISIDNIFLTNKLFKKRFNIDRETLIKKYF